jgi:hypothetical protein
VVNGFEPTVQTCGIEFIETAAAYFLARCFVRDGDDFYNVIQLLFRLVLILLPFALIEFVSGQNILLQLCAVICPTYTLSTEQRMGLTRVQSVFDHPILFGVFAASAVALVHLVLGHNKSALQRNLMTWTVGFTAVTSLSAGPLIAVIVQAALLSWNSFLSTVQVRWKLLIGLLITGDLTVELLANRSLPEIISSYLTFDDQSYWYRTVIWEYGSAAALNHPLFGAGLDRWERPPWMLGSIDNLWLYLAVRSGLPAPGLLLLALLSLFLTIGLKKGLDDRIAAYRTAFLITMSGFFVVSWTVDFWDAAYVLFLFLMGSGTWILDVETPKEVIVQFSPHPPHYRTGVSRRAVPSPG